MSLQIPPTTPIMGCEWGRQQGTGQPWKRGQHPTEHLGTLLIDKDICNTCHAPTAKGMNDQGAQEYVLTVRSGLCGNAGPGAT